MWLPDLPHHPVGYAGKLATRNPDSITQVVMHCTELPDMTMAREYAERALYDNGTGACGHLYVDTDGSVVQYVPLDRVAHHVRGHNMHTIGIELTNIGRYPHWYRSDHQAMTEPYPEPQINALLDLLGWLKAMIPALREIAGHEDLDRDLVDAEDAPGVKIRRKVDPGPLFPWEEVLASTVLQRTGADRSTES